MERGNGRSGLNHRRLLCRRSECRARWKRIAEAGDDKRLRLRNSKTAEVETDVRVHDRALSSVAWHPTLPFIVTTSADAKLRIWNLPDFKLVQEYRMRAPGLDVRISPNGKNL